MSAGDPAWADTEPRLMNGFWVPLFTGYFLGLVYSLDPCRAKCAPQRLSVTRQEGRRRCPRGHRFFHLVSCLFDAAPEPRLEAADSTGSAEFAASCGFPPLRILFM